MKRALSSLFMLSILAAAPAVAGGAAALKGAKLAPMAHVKLARARGSALKARPGKITDQELEKEKGGSGLRYSFDILSAGKSFEVGIDAKTGALLENAPEGKNPD